MSNVDFRALAQKTCAPVLTNVTGNTVRKQTLDQVAEQFRALYEQGIADGRKALLDEIWNIASKPSGN